MPRKTLKLENAIGLFFLIFLYFSQGYSLWAFSFLFFVPDLSLIAYKLHPQEAALYYNLCHTYAVPFLLTGIGYAFGFSVLWPIALIWAAHIAMDRALGFGLKYKQNFKLTTIQKL